MIFTHQWDGDFVVIPHRSVTKETFKKLQQDVTEYNEQIDKIFTGTADKSSYVCPTDKQTYAELSRMRGNRNTDHAYYFNLIKRKNDYWEESKMLPRLSLDILLTNPYSGDEFGCGFHILPTTFNLM